MGPSCECSTRCPHGHKCMGGHTNYPASHWYPCDKCTPAKTMTIKEIREDIRRRIRKSKGR